MATYTGLEQTILGIGNDIAAAKVYIDNINTTLTEEKVDKTVFADDEYGRIGDVVTNIRVALDNEEIVITGRTTNVNDGTHVEWPVHIAGGDGIVFQAVDAQHLTISIDSQEVGGDDISYTSVFE